MPAKIEIPPKVGVGTKCSFLALGLSKSLNLFYHKNYRRNKDQRENKSHDIGEDAKLEIGKID